MKNDPTLADESMRLLLCLACWILLYAISLFTTLSTAPGFYQWLGGFCTLVLATQCVLTGLQLYRVNKTMRNINK